METVFGLMLMLIAVCHGVETSCDGRQDGAQCFGALGGTVFIQLMNNASEMYWFHWIHRDTKILDWKNNRLLKNITENRFIFIPSNGTFRINDLRMNDGGKYELQFFNSDGYKTRTTNLQLSVQAPVSSVQLVPQCLSQGQMKVSCSSEGGDSPQYSWTLDGHTLTDSELLSVNKENNIIVLRQNVSGRLICSVMNHVSKLSKEKDLNQPVSSECGFIFINCTSNGTHISGWVFEQNNTLCVKPTTTPTTAPHSSAGKETTESYKHSTINSSSNQTSSDQPWYIKNLPIVAGVLAALLLCLIVGTLIICNQSKKTQNIVVEDDQELTYADVRIVQQRGRRVEQREEEGVEYGQIKFSEKPRQCEPTDDAVYAKVCKTR